VRIKWENLRERQHLSGASQLTQVHATSILVNLHPAAAAGIGEYAIPELFPRPHKCLREVPHRDWVLELVGHSPVNVGLEEVEEREVEPRSLSHLLDLVVVGQGVVVEKESGGRVAI
jgi:hypothetical protein